MLLDQLAWFLKHYMSNGEQPCAMEPSDSAPFLEAELFLTSGPRKPVEDTILRDNQLGEDAGGVLMRSDACYFWIADGTGDGGKHREFNARVLAQELGTSFNELVREKNPAAIGMPVGSVLSEVLETTRRAWSTRLTESQQKQPDLYSTPFDVSSVFLCGWLNAKGELRLANYGDAWSCFHNGKQIQGEMRNHHRFFLRFHEVTVAEGGMEWQVATTTEHCHGILEADNVEWVVVGSDGVGKIKECLMHAPISAQKIALAVRNMVRSMCFQSYDDKTLCFVRLVSSQRHEPHHP